MSSTRKLWTWVTILSVLSLPIFNSYLWQFYNYDSPQQSSTPVKTRSYPVTNGFDDEPSLLSINTSSLARREDYSCGPGRPCANGACCGGGGFCGYGPTYCGDGCVSNCNAHAECGKDSEPPNKICPLNTCCSEFGFCGTISTYCTGKCQSNCVLNPPPPGGSPKNSALKRMIGYYESWSYRSKCNQKSPSDLPLSELTHLNFAFAYIAPGSFDLIPMDDQTPESLWKLSTDAKQYNPSLKVFVAIGGWTFSDNDTVTQPLFGEIASTAANRQKFADNVVRFANRYGFDGCVTGLTAIGVSLDIDWEYPGAPDRGGKPEDTENFTLLMKTLRQTFNGSPRQLGLTFTAPSSYWYLKWFDLPGLVKYADWINLMSYDLHGTWDRNNPIGAIVQGHTNLTEIQLAAQLLWRVGIKPEQVTIGFGFYGRSFELSDPSCSKPGCRFKGGARPGPCSDTSGVLQYYEIQAILKQIPGLKPVHDEKAAVKYLVFDKNQWVSYDDAETFEQKIAWANSIGIGGSLIWAADTDDDKFTAMSGLVGKQVSHVDVQQKSLLPTVANVAANLIGQIGQECQVLKDHECRPSRDLRCEKGFSLVGWDRDGCKNGDEGKPICCPDAAAPMNCQWRGSGGDCNGQCHAGESTLFKSSWGGGFEAQSGTNKCGRGVKVFCCEAGDWKDTISGCYWTDCGNDCSSSAEMRVGRKRTDCCKVTKPPPPKLYCDITICDLDNTACSGDADFEYGAKRDLQATNSAVSDFALEKRGSRRPFKWYTTAGLLITQESLTYPTPSRYVRLLQQNLQGLSRRWWQIRSRDCGDPHLTQMEIGDTPPSDGQVEHPIPLVTASRFAAVANHGRQWRPIPTSQRNTVPDGERTRTPAIRAEFWQNVWNNGQGLPSGLPRVTPNSPELRRPVDRIYERMGSSTNPSHLTILRNSVNAAKGLLEIFRRPMSPDNLRTHVTAALAGSERDIQAFMAPLRDTVAMFQYLRDPDLVTRMDTIAAGVYSELQIIELNTQGSEGLSAHWNEFYPYYFGQVSEFVRNYVSELFSRLSLPIVSDSIRYIRQQYEASNDPNRESVLKELQEIEDKIPDMKYAFED
ncbi:hypothetical protein Daesc_007303 [Daldinia eschscholtzii]|uniref:chitinase n=1 Tax=Daldinia eschscholtzii TaxID=292717 RepID=A0AAX6MDL0_9PEZI